MKMVWIRNSGEEDDEYWEDVSGFTICQDEHLSNVLSMYRAYTTGWETASIEWTDYDGPAGQRAHIYMNRQEKDNITERLKKGEFDAREEAYPHSPFRSVNCVAIANFVPPEVGSKKNYYYCEFDDECGGVSLIPILPCHTWFLNNKNYAPVPADSFKEGLEYAFNLQRQRQENKV